MRNDSLIIRLNQAGFAVIHDAESDTKQAAVAITTKELARFFAKQGWITAEQADKYVGFMP